MIKQIKTKIRLLIENNLKGFILLAILFIAGATLASLQNFQTTEEEVRLYIKDFMQNVVSSGTDFQSTFNASFSGYLKSLVLMLLASLTVVGTPVIMAYALFEGVSFGVVLSCLIRTFGIKGFLIVLSAMIPHLIIALPSCMGYAVFAMKHSRKLNASKTDLKRNILKPIIFGILFLCASSIAALVQGYIEPLLIKLIASQFI